MKTDINLIKKLISGTAEIIENNGAVEFHRMTAEQRDILKNNQDFAMKAAATSGVKLEFATDASAVRLAGTFAGGSSRKFAFFDISVNGILSAHEGTDNYIEQPEFDFTVSLDGKLNRVAIYFPCLTKATLKTLEFTGSSTVEPIKKSRMIICYGDSITQGYDAVYPSFAYTNLLADALDAEILNKAIGGEIFNPAFGSAPDPVRPDLITVAYGTNDWRKGETAESLRANAAGFFAALTRNYPEVPIVALLPIWRKDMMDIHPSGNLESAIATLRDLYSELDNVAVVDGMPLVPHLPEFFADGYLHPNDSGFLLYGHNLLNHPALAKFKNAAL